LNRQRADDGRSLRAATAAFQRPALSASLVQLGVSLACFLGACALMYVVAGRSTWATLALGLVAGGFLVRLFVIQHDCGHGSFFRSRAANTAVGMLCSVLTMTPFAAWRRQHAGHHGIWNDLDRRQSGLDIYSTCRTVAEYRALGPWRRRWYRLVRHPLVANVLLPPFVFLLLYRVPFDMPRGWSPERWAVHGLNAVLAAIVVGLGLAFGFGEVALVQLPVIVAGSIVGVWLFTIQHRFETTLWARHGAWSPVAAALRGSSYLRLPRPLEWLTGSIGLHHVHHLDPRIPNYRLRACLEAVPALRAVPGMTLWDGLRALRLALWDEDRQRMVTFREAARRPSRGARAGSPCT